MEIVPSRLGGTCTMDVPPTPGELRMAEWTGAALGTFVFPLAALITWLLFAQLMTWLPIPNRSPTAADGLAMLLFPLILAMGIALNVPGWLARRRAKRALPVLTLCWQGDELTLSGPVEATLDMRTVRWVLAEGLALHDGDRSYAFPSIVLDVEAKARLSEALTHAQGMARERFDDPQVPEQLQRLGARAASAEGRTS